MKTSGLFCVHGHTINVKYNRPFKIIFFGDVHRDSPDHAHGKWSEFLEYARRQKDAFFFGMGDYLDSTSTSEREMLGHISTKMHETFRHDIEALQVAKVEKMAEELSFMRGRIIGMLNGNHYFQFQSGMNSDQLLCQKLSAKYLGVCAFVRLYFKNGGRHHSRDIFAHHGAGAARLIGGSLNRVQQMAEGAEADIYCVSDDTEVLTSNGWKKRPEIKKGDLVGAMEMSNGEFRWSVVKSKVEFDYSGNAIAIKTPQTDQILHPKHRVVKRHQLRKRVGDWSFNEAEKIWKQTGQIEIPLAAKTPEGISVTLSDELIELCGWIIAEGSFGISGIRITQKHIHKRAAIRRLLESAGIKFSENDRKDGVGVFYIPASERQKIDRLLPDGKNIPSWAWGCSDKQFTRFLNGLVEGDGYRQNERAFSFYQSSEKVIDDLQAVLSSHGYRTAKVYKKGGFKHGGWELRGTMRQHHTLALAKGKIKTVDYDGVMWCVTTEHGTFIARRNGRVFATGNCMGHDHKKGAAPAQPRLFLSHSSVSGLKVEQREPVIVRSGSYLASFRDGQVNYNVDACRPPSSLGHVEVIITVKDVRRYDGNKAIERENDIEMRTLV